MLFQPAGWPQASESPLLSAPVHIKDVAATTARLGPQHWGSFFPLLPGTAQSV